jgi:hypothetical protein
MHVSLRPLRPKAQTKTTKASSSNESHALQFITTTGKFDRNDPGTAKAVRSHVMRRYRQEQRKQKSTKRDVLDVCSSSLPLGIEEQDDDGILVVHDKSSPYNSRKRTSGSGLPGSDFLNCSMALHRTPVDVCRSDPFNCLPTASDPASDLLLEFC